MKYNKRLAKSRFTIHGGEQIQSSSSIEGAKDAFVSRRDDTFCTTLHTSC